MDPEARNKVPAPGVQTDTTAQAPVLEAVGLTKHFPVRRRGRGSQAGRRPVVHAVEDVSIALYEGQVTALVGESGSGKSTIARLLAQLYGQTGGTILLRGRPVRVRQGQAFRSYARSVQIVFQDPFSSLNPVRTVRQHLVRRLRAHHGARRREVDAALNALLAEVNLVPPQQFLEKFPHELSGGQRQRVAIARALASQPSVLLADEPVSMLDVSIRLGVLNLLERLAKEHRLALLYITHDIASARYFAATTLVMYAGQLVEGGPSEAVTQSPAHPYTQLLIASAPNPNRVTESAGNAGDPGEPPSLINPPSGCRFHPRCPHAMDVCAERSPARTDLGEGHWVCCWLHVRSDPAEDPSHVGREA